MNNFPKSHKNAIRVLTQEIGEKSNELMSFALENVTDDQRPLSFEIGDERIEIIIKEKVK